MILVVAAALLARVAVVLLVVTIVSLLARITVVLLVVVISVVIVLVTVAIAGSVTISRVGNSIDWSSDSASGISRRGEDSDCDVGSGSNWRSVGDSCARCGSGSRNIGNSNIQESVRIEIGTAGQSRSDGATGRNSHDRGSEVGDGIVGSRSSVIDCTENQLNWLRSRSSSESGSHRYTDSATIADVEVGSVLGRSAQGNDHVSDHAISSSGTRQQSSIDG